MAILVWDYTLYNCQYTNSLSFNFLSTILKQL